MESHSDAAKRIEIDSEELIDALKSQGDELEYYLDRSTGEIVLRSDEGITGESDDLEHLFEDEPDRFVFIQPVSSSIGFQIMVDFIEHLPPGKASDSLVRAVRLSKPFRRFKDALLDYPDVRERWFAFEYRRWVELARESLKDEGIEADLIERPADR